VKMLALAPAVLVLLGVTGANAQDYPVPYGAPYFPPPVVAPPPGPVVVAPAPDGGAYMPGPYPGSIIVNPYTGRWCTFQPDGWHWCWTP
jgi:hypothetical protein